MKLRPIRYADRIVKSKQVKFAGLDFREGAADGAIRYMENMTGDYYPMLASRQRREIISQLAGQPGGLGAWDKLFWVDGTDFVYDGKVVGQVSAGQKVFGCMMPYVVILPDKAYYNTYTGEFGLIESTWSGNSLQFESTTQFGEDAQANTIRWAVDWREYFRPGDAVTISGCTKHPYNNRTSIIQEIQGDKLIFSENCFELDGDDGLTKYLEEGALTITRQMPDLLYCCENENRLWGCTKDTIWSCKRGDIFNWYAMDAGADSSYSVGVGSAGEFTGCISYGGYPVFFKEDHIYKVYGSLPSNFSVLGSATMGLAKGCNASLAVAGETLFYLSHSGVVAYTGGIPQLVSEELGRSRYRSACGGSDGRKYYATLMDVNDEEWLYVYDTRTGLWHREDEMDAVGFTQLGGALYCLNREGTVLWMNPDGLPTAYPTEPPVRWVVEFADFTEDEPNVKGLGKLQLRVKLGAGSTMTVKIRYDSEAEEHTVSTVVGDGRKQSYYLPIVPRRCDHYRLRLKGEGVFQLQSLVREYYVGSEIRPGRR